MDDAPAGRGVRRGLAGVVAFVAVIATGCGTSSPANHQSSGSATASSAATSSARSHPAQSVLPFGGLHEPSTVAVDSAGTVYVADAGDNRVVALAAGSSAPTVLPFTDLQGPHGVAVDGAGNLYVATLGDNRVLKLAAG